MIKKLFCQATSFNFFSSQNSFCVMDISFNFFSSENSFFVMHVSFNFLSNQNSFFVKHISFNFFSRQNSFFIMHIKFEKHKALKKELSEELIPLVWHPNRWCDLCVSENEKKEIDPMFIE